MTITLTIPRLAPSLNGSKGLMRMHYRTYAKTRDAWTVLTVHALDAHPEWRHLRLPLADRVEIHIERRYARQPLDLDNLYASAKVPLDALRRSQIIRDDDPETVTALRMTQTKVGRVASEETRINITVKA